MQSFECDGYFWLPEKPDDLVVGRLKCEHDGSSELNLSGTLGNPHEHQKTHVTVLGVADNCPIGRAVTLWDATWAGQTISMPGLIRERYRPKTLLGGLHLPAESEVLFRGCEFRFSGLDVWANGLTGLQFESQSLNSNGTIEHIIRCSVPLVRKFDCGDDQYRLCTRAGVHQTWRKGDIQEKIVLEVQPSKPHKLEELNDTYVYPLQNFFTLACDRPNALVCWEVDLLSTNESESTQTAEVRFPRYFADEEAAAQAYGKLLFTLEDVSDLGDVIGRWFSISDKYGTACNLYFGIQYSPSLYLDLKFQTVLQALTLYATAKGSPNEQASDPHLEKIFQVLSDNLKTHLSNLLQTSFLLNAEAALMALTNEHDELIQWLFGNTSQKFVNRTINTLHYLQTRDPVNLVAASRGSDLYFLTQQLSWLMKLCFLTELGFTADERKQILHRNQQAQFIHVNARQQESGPVASA